MNIRKRNGQSTCYQREKIERVIRLAFESTGKAEAGSIAEELAEKVEQQLEAQGQETIAVESIQDQVEEALMVANDPVNLRNQCGRY